MEDQKISEVDKDKNDSVVFTKIVAVVLTIIFVFSLLAWLPMLMVLPIALDGGLKLNAIALIISMIMYPIWAVWGLMLLWKHQEPKKDFGLVTAGFFIALLLSFFA